jgi:hypothetical protein
MVDIYIDDSGGFDAKSPILLIGAHYSTNSVYLREKLEGFEKYLNSRVQLQVYLEDYQKNGLHACDNHPAINAEFFSLLNIAGGRYSLIFTQKKTNARTLKKSLYIKVLVRLLHSLIQQANNDGEVANIIYESADSYLSGNVTDNEILKKAILSKNPNANITVEGKDKSFKLLSFVDYACYSMSNNIARILARKTVDSAKAVVSSFDLVFQNTSMLIDFDRDKFLTPRKSSKQERDLEQWVHS